MDIYLFNILTLIGGLCLFLFGMNIMGQSLERRTGNKLRNLLAKLTTNKFAGLSTGIGVTAVIQSSSATTVMVVGFVNSGLMTLSQAINVIMGANIGTTVTAWILSLSGIESSNIFMQLLKPSSFTPMLALIGIIFYMFCKNDKKKDTGMILLGFATLMFGMETMSDAVAFLEEVPQFSQLFVMFKNPIMGMLAGLILTAIIQSSSASVGILQALAVTGQVSYGAAIPIVMGQNIGTCITTLLSAIGANKNAKRAALVHLSFNVIGTTVWLAAYWILKSVFSPVILEESATALGIAVCHSIFNLLCMLLLFPTSRLLENAVTKIIPDSKSPEEIAELDERLLATPPIALQRCRELANMMAQSCADSFKYSTSLFNNYKKENIDKVYELEEESDHYEDVLGSYLVKLSALKISADDNREAAMLLKAIGDFERISDHSVNIVESIIELREKNLEFSENAMYELNTMARAVTTIVNRTLSAFIDNDFEACAEVEPLEEIVDGLKEEMRLRHIYRLQQSGCSIEAGFVWNDLLTNFERISDHCSNIAGGIIDNEEKTMNIHESLRKIKATDEKYKELLAVYSKQFDLNNI